MSIKELSNHALAVDLKNELTVETGKKFTARPWNKFQPDSTLWWVVPSIEWPSYKHGKIVVFKDGDDRYLGYHIEKGVSEIVKEMLSKSQANKICMQDDWAWHKLVSDISNEKFQETIRNLKKMNPNNTWEVLIKAHPVSGERERPNPIEGLETENEISFLINNYEDKISLINKPKGNLKEFNKINTLSELNKIFDNQEFDWFWIDVYIITSIKEFKKDDFLNLGKHLINTYHEIII